MRESMESILKNLFDLQRFVLDPQLQTLIDETERRYDEELTDEELELLAAAGDLTDGWHLPSPEDLRP